MIASVDLSLPTACSIHVDAILHGFLARGWLVDFLTPRLNAGKKLAINVEAPNLEVVSTAPASRWHLPRTFSMLLLLPTLWALASRRKYDAAYVRFSPLAPITVWAFRHLWPGIPVITEHNGWVASEASLSGWPGFLCRMVAWLQVADARLADAVRAVTREVADRLISAGGPPAKVFVAENGVDLERMHPLPRDRAVQAAGLDAVHTHIGFLGTMTPWQGVDVLLRAAARLFPEFPQLRLVIGGGGPGLPAMERLAAELGIAEKVKFLGWVASERANAVINAFDVAVAPYHFPLGRPIGSPVKIRDYAAAGRPVVAASYPVITSVVHSDWCLLHRPGDDGDLAAQLGALIVDPERRAAMGTAARRQAEKGFGWDTVLDDILSRIPQSVR